MYGDAASGLTEREGDRLSDAMSGARDERDPAFQVQRPPPPRIASAAPAARTRPAAVSATVRDNVAERIGLPSPGFVSETSTRREAYLD